MHLNLALTPNTLASLYTMTSSLTFWGHFLLTRQMASTYKNDKESSHWHCSPPKAHRLTLPYVVHPNWHPKEFWLGPDMSIELYLLIKTLSIKGWNWREIVSFSALYSLILFINIHTINIHAPPPPTPLTQRNNWLHRENPLPFKEHPWMWSGITHLPFTPCFPQCKPLFRTTWGGTSWTVRPIPGLKNKGSVCSDQQACCCPSLNLDPYSIISLNMASSK